MSPSRARWFRLLQRLESGTHRSPAIECHRRRATGLDAQSGDQRVAEIRAGASEHGYRTPYDVGYFEGQLWGGQQALDPAGIMNPGKFVRAT